MLLRGLLAGVACLTAVGCAGPGGAALWQAEEARREQESYRLSDRQREASAWLAEARSADELWAADHLQLQQALAACPGGSQPAAPSAAGRRRDGVRLRAGADRAAPVGPDQPARARARQALLDAAEQDAWADWQLRRGAATRDSSRCEAARAALARSDRAAAAAREAAALVAGAEGLPWP